MQFSIVILTYNRKERLAQQMCLLADIARPDLEIIVVDNCSEEPVDKLVLKDPRVKYIRNSVNEGAVGRNRGMAAARGAIVITLDDDVYGLMDKHFEILVELMKDRTIAAVNFKVQAEYSGKVTDWCHPYPPETHADFLLETNDISEGAVAFRKQALEEVGLYPEYFFISHEGPDLALRLINAGWRVIYCPTIVITHAYEQLSRTNWRRYYYDTRNQLWLVLRNLSFWYGLRRLCIGWSSMFVYALRDGYLQYWFKAVWDSLAGASRAWEDRIPPVGLSKRRLREIEKFKPGFFKMVQKRLFRREVRI